MAGEETTNQQSNINLNYNAGQIGLDLDRIPSQINKGKLTYALNANLENFDYNSITYQNEEGNEIVFLFPTGYHLIGQHYIQEKRKHIFFLANPDTGDSEIGYMLDNDWTYNTLLNNTCLNFNVQYPIHKSVHRITNCSTEVYWTDGYNERRFIDVDNPPTTGDICNQLSIQPNFNIPQINIEEIMNGGDLQAGTYQFAIQYCDALGYGYTSYYSVTNPISLADPDITSPNFDYTVNKSIKATISNLETNGYFTYFNLAVIKTVNSITSVELVGTYYINEATEDIIYTGQSKTDIRLSINDIFEKFAYYEIADDVTSAQDILIWSNLTSNARINYQSIAADITLNWETYKIPQGSNYSDPLNTSLLRGYLRDEVYAFEIVFLLRNGQQTDGFHIPGREAVASDLVSIPNTNHDYIGSGTEAPTWKIYNTASVTGSATGDTINGATPYEYGEFAYWESSEDYPANSVFSEAGLTGPIRHHKFPDVSISPIFETLSYPGTGDITPTISNGNAVYPIGVRVDTQQVWNLIQASSLTDEEKADITGFKIVRANRSGNASIVGKGILRNVGKYQRGGTSYYYPNYPYNDVNADPFLLDVDESNPYRNKSYGFIKQALTYNITSVTAPGTVTYVDGMSGDTKEVYISLGGTICSLSKPILSPGMVATVTSYKSTATTVIITVNDTVSTTLTVGSPYTGSTTTSITALPGDHYFIVDGAQTITRTSGSFNYKIVDTQATFSHECMCDQLNGLGGLYTASTESEERMVFNSPETSFGSPTLGSVLKLESVMFGGGKSHFVEVEKNAKYKFISKLVQKQALDASYQLANVTGTFDASAMFTTYQAYLQIYINSINAKNYGYSYNSYLSYNYITGISNAYQDTQRELDICQYLIPGVQSTGDTYNINNYNRETSVYIKSLGEPLPFPHLANTDVQNRITDYSRFTLSDVDGCSTPEQQYDIQSITYYGSLKNIAVSQYGQMYSYQTIDTGFQFDFDSTLGIQTVFGGDTFISRFAFKTKLPFFIDNRVGAPDNSDVFYDEIGNVAYPKFWHSSRSIISDYQAGTTNLQGIVSTKSTWFDCSNYQPFQSTSVTTTTATAGSTVTVPPGAFYDGKIYMFAYGIPYFYVESSINLDLRQATNNKDGDFYPHVSSGIPDKWLQEYNVPIALDNTYNYNITYSKQNSENFFSHLPFDWTSDACRTYYPFRTIYSDPQVSDPTTSINNWLIYRPVSYFDFPQNYGNLISLDGIQNKAILVRFENKTLLYNNLLTIDTSNPQAAYIGNDKLFRAAPPIDFAETDLGYVGTQNKLLLRIPYGQITVDAKRGQIFLIQGTSAVDLTGPGSGITRFMTDHLSFEILDYFPTVPVDNAFTGVGLCGVFDSKYDRVIITKLDYVPKEEYADTMTYDSATNKFYVGEQEVSLGDSLYFCNRSFTISFSFVTKSWISFHSYLAHFYIGDNNFFYSGNNGGLWSHLTATSQFNTYYGGQYPYIIEYPFAYQYQDEIVQNVKDYTTAYVYTRTSRDRHDVNSKIEVNDYFNKAMLYNGQQNSGWLELVKKPQNNLAAYNQYPMYFPDIKRILYTKSDNFYQYNTFWNIYSNKTQPMFYTPCETHSLDKEINQDVMDYGTRSFRKDTLRAKDLKIRHMLDNRTDLHLVSKFIVAPTQISYK